MEKLLSSNSPKDVYLFSDHKIYQHIIIKTERVSLKYHKNLNKLASDYKIETKVKPIVTRKICYMEIEIKGFFDSIQHVVEFTKKLNIN